AEGRPFVGRIVGLSQRQPRWSTRRRALTRIIRDVGFRERRRWSSPRNRRNHAADNSYPGTPRGWDLKQVRPRRWIVPRRGRGVLCGRAVGPVVPPQTRHPRGHMEADYRIAAVWIALALLASLTAVRLKQSVALVEILVGILAGNLAVYLTQHQFLGFDWRLEVRPWLLFLAGFGSMLLTFLAGAEIEPAVLRRHYKESLAIGMASFAAPFVARMAFARYVSARES